MSTKDFHITHRRFKHKKNGYIASSRGGNYKLLGITLSTEISSIPEFLIHDNTEWEEIFPVAIKKNGIIFKNEGYDGTYILYGNKLSEDNWMVNPNTTGFVNIDAIYWNESDIPKEEIPSDALFRHIDEHDKHQVSTFDVLAKSPKNLTIMPPPNTTDKNYNSGIDPIEPKHTPYNPRKFYCITPTSGGWNIGDKHEPRCIWQFEESNKWTEVFQITPQTITAYTIIPQPGEGKAIKLLEGLSGEYIIIDAESNTGTTVKPPLGIMPLKLHNELRLDELNKAIGRYQSVGKAIPKEWEEEHRVLNGVKPSSPTISHLSAILQLEVQYLTELIQKMPERVMKEMKNRENPSE